MQRFHAEVVPILLAAGWSPGRIVPVAAIEWWEQSVRAAGVTIVPGFRAILREFGGLKVGSRAPGVECARSDIRFDPTLSLDTLDLFEAYEADLRQPLCPLGDVWETYASLALAADGSIYALMDDLYLLGPSIEEALRKVLLGYRSPCLKRDGTWQFD